MRKRGITRPSAGMFSLYLEAVLAVSLCFPPIVSKSDLLHPGRYGHSYSALIPAPPIQRFHFPISSSKGGYSYIAGLDLGDADRLML